MSSPSDAKFWCPQAVQRYHDYLQQGLPQGVFVTYRRAYIRNISYAFQYLEYFISIIQRRLHVVVENQLRKSFIITGCSVIESILWMLLKGTGVQKQNQWTEIQKRATNPYRYGDDEFKFEVRQYRKESQPVDVEMRFIDMCRRAEKRQVLGVASDVYAKIGHLRKLRNRVHIYSVQHDQDNDWWTFESKDVETMKEVLREVLQSEIFSESRNYDELFYWLETTKADDKGDESL